MVLLWVAVDVVFIALLALLLRQLGMGTDMSWVAAGLGVLMVNINLLIGAVLAAGKAAEETSTRRDDD